MPLQRLQYIDQLSCALSDELQYLRKVVRFAYYRFVVFFQDDNCHFFHSLILQEMDFVGDVMDRDVIIVDDMCDTGGTLTKAAKVLKKLGARDIYV